MSRKAPSLFDRIYGQNLSEEDKPEKNPSFWQRIKRSHDDVQSAAFGDDPGPRPSFFSKPLTHITHRARERLAGASKGSVAPQPPEAKRKINIQVSERPKRSGKELSARGHFELIRKDTEVVRRQREREKRAGGRILQIGQAQANSPKRSSDKHRFARFQ